MEYIKHLGFLQIELHRITKINEDPRTDIAEKLLIDLITLMAKHELVTNRYIFDFSRNEKCEQRDNLHLSLIKAGMQIEKENQLLE
ncbi:hypothetical protein [Bacillus sp. V5-8f]|uniref:hypothetical protein n=1 Tax=Bacillus sp. V5-8f TaxID=2053044 RepID=UPI000C75EB02|nr:hypothetical protein [Bacillus sp. V5-8f]PLT33655.1 hypothetical protein CUU64_11030 [Bacillus sp. V5-8f]